MIERNRVKEVKVYKAIQNNTIDELFTFDLNKYNVNMPIKPIGLGKYFLGAK